MVILKEIKVSESNKTKSELLVIGYFKDSSSKKTINYLSLEDSNKISEAILMDLSDSKEGNNISIYGSSSFKRIMIYNLGDKKKVTNDKIRAHGSKIYSLVNAKQIKSIDLDVKSFDVLNNTELGFSYNHLSNASLGDKNPGANSYMFNFLKSF